MAVLSNLACGQEKEFLLGEARTRWAEERRQSEASRYMVFSCLADIDRTLYTVQLVQEGGEVLATLELEVEVASVPSSTEVAVYQLQSENVSTNIITIMGSGLAATGLLAAINYMGLMKGLRVGLCYMIQNAQGQCLSTLCVVPIHR